MKATGIVRRIDELGRISLPRELHRTLDIGAGDFAEIFVEADAVVLRKYKPGCFFCGGMDGLIEIDGKTICKRCAERITARLRSVSKEDKNG